MRDETLYAAYEATYLADFRWIKAALHITYTPGPVAGTGRTGPVLFSPTQRAAIYARDGGRCYLCGLPVDADQHDGPWASTIDHVRPLSHHGARKDLRNLALAHWQCNHDKGSSPHPRTVYETDHWQCRRCQEAVSRGPQQPDWHWNRPIVEHLVPLASPDIWWYTRSWTCHLHCHAYRLPVPPSVAEQGTVTVSPVPLPSEPVPLLTLAVGDTALSVRCPPHDWWHDVDLLTGSEFERCRWCQQRRPHRPRPRQRCEACGGTGFIGRVSYPSACSACGGLGFIELLQPTEDAEGEPGEAG
jgi:hypothetical protein